MFERYLADKRRRRPLFYVALAIAAAVEASLLAVLLVSTLLHVDEIEPPILRVNFFKGSQTPPSIQGWPKSGQLGKGGRKSATPPKIAAGKRLPKLPPPPPPPPVPIAQPTRVPENTPAAKGPPPHAPLATAPTRTHLDDAPQAGLTQHTSAAPTRTYLDDGARTSGGAGTSSPPTRTYLEDASQTRDLNSGKTRPSLPSSTKTANQAVDGKLSVASHSIELTSYYELSAELRKLAERMEKRLQIKMLACSISRDDGTRCRLWKEGDGVWIDCAPAKPKLSLAISMLRSASEGHCHWGD